MDTASSKGNGTADSSSAAPNSRSGHSPSTSRRRFLLAGTAAAAGLTLALRPEDLGQNHRPYFQQLSQVLDRVQLARPTLVIDRQRLLSNISTLQQHIKQRFDYRIVAKSLPSLSLLDSIMQHTQTRRLMLFHGPFIVQAAQRFSDADILLGKPLPVTAAANVYRELGNLANTTFNPSQQIHWLIDSPERLQQYLGLADSLQQPLQIAIELDVGLHRGGVTAGPVLAEMLEQIRNAPRLRLTALMGYEPHIVKLPGNPVTHQEKAMVAYRNCVEQVTASLDPLAASKLILNCAGSPTYQLYDHGQFPFNELAAGSCLVKPTDFDLPTLRDHQAAAFIATPVLKTQHGAAIPGLPGLDRLLAWWNPNRAQSVFTYGGYWKAHPESPQGLDVHPIYGRSSNQEMLTGSQAIDLNVDDWVFLRPTQSEFVFLQFGDIAVYDQGELSDFWPILSATS